jgi:hypothetical protein
VLSSVTGLVLGMVAVLDPHERQRFGGRIVEGLAVWVVIAVIARVLIAATPAARANKQ